MTKRCFIINVVTWLCLLCVAATPPPLPKKKAVYKSATGVTQGAGAIALLSAPVQTNYWTISVTWNHPNLSQLTNFSLHSGPTSTNYTSNWLTGKVLTNQFQQSKKTLRYYSVTALGTNGEESAYSNEIHYPLTNLLITVTATNGSTNILFSPSPFGPWTSVNANTLSRTNPTTPIFFRGIGNSMGRVVITRSYQ